MPYIYIALKRVGKKGYAQYLWHFEFSRAIISLYSVFLLLMSWVLHLLTRCSGDCRLSVWQSCHVQCDVKRNTLYKPFVSIMTYPFFKFLKIFNFICPSRHAERTGLMRLTHWFTNVIDQCLSMFYVFCMWGTVLTFFFFLLPCIL